MSINDSPMGLQKGFAELSNQWSLIKPLDLSPEKNKQIKSISLVVAAVTGISAGVLVLACPVALPAIIALGSIAALASATWIGFQINSVLQYRKICQTAGMFDTSVSDHMNNWKSTTPTKTAMLPTEHCSDTHYWRKRLLQAAKHNVVISGNYCGGQSFDEILSLIKRKMQKNPEFRVVILSSPNFLKNETIKIKGLNNSQVKVKVKNKKQIKELQKLYPTRFSLVETPDVFMTGTGIKKVTNHTKYFGIDGGKYYILGGSAIKDNFNFTGVDDPLSLSSSEMADNFNEELNHLKMTLTTLTSKLPKLFDELNSSENISDAKQHLINFCSEFAGIDLKEIESKFSTIPSVYRARLYRKFTALTKLKAKAIRKANELIRNIESTPHASPEIRLLKKHIEQKIKELKVYSKGLDAFLSLVRSALGKKDFEHALANFSEQTKAFLPKTKDASLEEHPIVRFFTSFGGFVDSLKPFFKSYSPGVLDKGVTGLLVPGNFRDMDFVFHDLEGGNSQGRQLFIQMLMLAFRWEQFNASNTHNKTAEKYSPQSAPFFPILIPNGKTFSPEAKEKAEKARIVLENDTPLVHFLKSKLAPAEEITTTVPKFDTHQSLEKEGAVKILYTGPEQDNNSGSFQKEVINQINAAKDEITINHMYFHPNSPVFKALVRAVKRGVKLKLITAGVFRDAPNGQKIFGPRNKANYVRLLNRLSADEKKNVEIYEFTQAKKGLHKKVMIFDKRHVLAGSSNFGYKSLVTTSDHEVNFLADSTHFAEQTYKIFEQDIQRSTRVNLDTKLSFKEKKIASLHWLFAALIG